MTERTTVPEEFRNRGRQTFYKGIKMRSRLEAVFAAHADHHGMTWEYEPCAFADEAGIYLPDFRLTTRSGVAWYVEVKGPFVADPTELQRRMETIWATDSTARLFLFDTHGQSWFGVDGQWAECDGLAA